MWITPLTEAYEHILRMLLKLGYEERKAEQGAAWFTALGVLLTLWLIAETLALPL